MAGVVEAVDKAALAEEAAVAYKVVLAEVYKEEAV